jgi:hypothetical protein
MKSTLLITMVLFGLMLSAQTFTEVPVLRPIEGVSSGSVAFADVDGDQDMDLLVTGNDTSSTYIAKLYINNGSGSFVEQVGNSFEGVAGSSVAFADIDGDNDKDVLIAGWGTSGRSISKLYTNNGIGLFTEKQGTPFVGVVGGSVAFADVDGDNDQDVLITGTDSARQRFARLYLNDGTGAFTEKTGNGFDNGVENGSVAFADADGDQDLDVFISGSDPLIYSKLFENDGTGTFTEKAGNHYLRGAYYSSVAFADVDGDNDQDILVSGRSGPAAHTSLYINDGTGIFRLKPGTRFKAVFRGAVAFADIDGDNDQDVLVTGVDTAGMRHTNLYTNDGAGFFREKTGTTFWGLSTSSIAFADVDGDGDQDIVVSGSAGGSFKVSGLYINDGTGVFVEQAINLIEGTSFGAVAFADVDGDDDADFLLSGYQFGEGVSKLYLNDGSGIFAKMDSTPFGKIVWSTITFADTDGDQDQDVFITGVSTVTGNPVSKLYTNDGTGAFAEKAGTSFEGISEGSVAFTDVDGDNDPDLIITGHGNGPQPVTKLYANDGAGSYTEMTSTPFIPLYYGSLSVADVDGDNDQDVLITGGDSLGVPLSRLYINNGSGVFSEDPDTPFVQALYNSVYLTDVDNDSDPDALFVGADSRLYVNDGQGTFSEKSGLPFDTVSLSAIALADIDGDGDTDLLLSGYDDGKVTRLYTNNGQGDFTELQGTPFVGVTGGVLAIEDIDGDNDMDVFVMGNADLPPLIARLYLNDGPVSSIENTIRQLPFAFTLYPNPATANKLNIRCSTEKSSMLSVKIVDLSGRLLHEQQQRLEAGEQTFSVDITSLSEGSYFLILDDGARRGARQFVIY